MSILGPIASALIGVVATLVVQELAEWVRSKFHAKHGEFTGRWFGILLASGGKGERHEVMKVHQRGQVLEVAIKRYFPLHEAGRKWKMTAYCHGNVLIGVFYTVVPKKDPSSYGAIVLHRDHRIKEATVWRGYYIRPDSGTLEQIANGDFERHPIVWQQDKPEDRNFGGLALPASGDAALNSAKTKTTNNPARPGGQRQNP